MLKNISFIHRFYSNIVISYRNLAKMSNDYKITMKNAMFHRCRIYFSPMIVFATRSKFTYVVFGLTTVSSYIYINPSYCFNPDDVFYRSRNESITLNRSFVADAAEKVLPSVVNIVCNIQTVIATGASSGSGFIISKDGFIVTNAHVVSHAKDGKVGITMSNMSKKYGYVHSLDQKTDIALIKMEDLHGEDLPVATLGQSNLMRVGDFVVALGSPLYLQNTVTFGIISALSRHGTELGMTKSRNEFIQTDASINVGNSGGPLVNLDGEVIGINVMKAQGVDGISFAIPIDTAKQIIKQLMHNKRVVRPHVGIRMTKVLQKGINSKRDKFGNPALQIVVQEVEANSPAYFAGIRSGDIILEVDGKEVKNIHTIIDAIGYEAGNHVRFRIKKPDGQEVETTFRTAAES